MLSGTRILDISIDTRPGMLHWPQSTAPEKGFDLSHEAGDGAEASWWKIGSHNGTHVDAPLHFVPGGATIEQLDLEPFVGPARVADLTARGDRPIDAQAVDSLDLDGVVRVLFRTTNSLRRLDGSEFDPSYVGIAPSGARTLIDRGMKLVGIDYLSVEVFTQEDFAAHHHLLGDGMAILEGIDLRAIAAGDYWLFAPPVRLAGSDGSPARAILIQGAAP